MCRGYRYKVYNRSILFPKSIIIQCFQKIGLQPCCLNFLKLDEVYIIVFVSRRKLVQYPVFLDGAINSKQLDEFLTGSQSWYPLYNQVSWFLINCIHLKCSDIKLTYHTTGQISKEAHFNDKKVEGAYFIVKVEVMTQNMNSIRRLL